MRSVYKHKTVINTLAITENDRYFIFVDDQNKAFVWKFITP